MPETPRYSFLMERMTHLNNILNAVWTSPHSSFYRALYEEKSSYRGGNIHTLDEIPILNAADLANVPFEERSYVQKDIFMKMVKKDGGFFLFGRTIRDIGTETYGPVGFRPLVIGNDCRDAVEFGLWCYEQNILPLISEENPSITANLAAIYEIDSILGETEALIPLLPDLSKRYDFSVIKTFSLGGTSFNIPLLRSYFPTASMRFFIWLPETGSIAASCPEHLARGELLFHPDKNNLLEIEETLVVSKLIFLPTPLIRYDTRVRAKILPTRCCCNATSFILPH